MNINKVTITGLDTLMDIRSIMELQDKYPFCEWGILFSSKKEGSARYPTMWTIENITRAGIKLSAHFCGSWAKEVLEKQNFDVISKLHPSFKRVQLNYNFSYNHQWSLTHLILFADLNRDRDIILQYNKSNKSTIDTFKKEFPENIHLLYDASGGRGAEIANIMPPFANYTGYAGGINDNNISSICQMITEYQDKSNVWIDMESGVRTDDVFDLVKVETVLASCSNFI